MTNITLDGNALRYISAFEKVTKTVVKDCIETPDKLVFIVAKGQIGAAIGKKGENIRRLHEMFKKNLDVIEYSDDPERFLRNIFHNYKIKGIEIEKRGTKNHAIVSVESKDKGKIIGKDGRNLKLAKDILNRHHDIEGLSID
ncbi:MAG: NusA-like transcription termination signal-binding factor [Methanomassiliicoccales archaeon]|nr:MAG: NusA-like transcription termination signal-binding factor [Methanomassiliicoccales archaeon]